MKVFLLFDIEKELIFPYPDLVKVILVSVGKFDFSDQFPLLTVPKI